MPRSTRRPVIPVHLLSHSHAKASTAACARKHLRLAFVNRQTGCSGGTRVGAVLLHVPQACRRVSPATMALVCQTRRVYMSSLQCFAVQNKLLSTLILLCTACAFLTAPAHRPPSLRTRRLCCWPLAAGAAASLAHVSSPPRPARGSAASSAATIAEAPATW